MPGDELCILTARLSEMPQSFSFLLLLVGRTADARLDPTDLYVHGNRTAAK